MTPRDSCAVCGSPSLIAYPAVLSPFIAERVGAAARACALLECRRCGHRCFDTVLEEEQLGRLYEGYRGGEYLRVRRRWEPWYTRRANDAIGNDPIEIAERRTSLASYLKRFVPADVLAGAVLDYGGDRGQFIPPEIGATKYLFEVSGQPACEGVTPLRSAASLRDHAIDLVLVCHVLEHVGEPVAFLRQVRRELGAPSAHHWLYVEVPLERHRILKRPRSAGACAPEVPFVARSRLAWLALDFYSTVCRLKLGVVPPLGVIKLHEHVNFFTPTSLRSLLGRAGYDVVDATVGHASSRAGITRVLRIVGRCAGPGDAVPADPPERRD